MPSVYLSKLNSGKPLPIFSQKRIADQMPGVVGEVPISITSDFYAIPPQLYKYMITCISTNKLVDTTQDIYHNAFKPIQTLGRLYEVPVSTFRFKNLGTTETAELKAMGLQQDTSNSNLFVGTPASHNLARINNLGPIDDRTRPGHLNFDGFLAWVYLMKGIQIFTTVKNTMVKKGFNTLMDTALSIPVRGSGGIARMDGDRMDYINKFNEAVGGYSGTFVLAPPTTDASGFAGSIRDISNDYHYDDGMFFPFFTGMNLQDKTTSYEVFKRFFQGTLSDTANGDAKIMAKIRVGVRQLSFSRTGMVIAHIYKCFEIANEICGAKVSVLTKGNTYVGTVIEGTFELRMYSKVFQVGSIAEEVGKVDLVDSQAQSVCDLLNAAEDGNGAQVYHFSKSDFIKSRIALRSYNSVEPSVFASTDTMSKVRDILSSMEFNDVFPVADQGLLVHAISYMSSGDFSELAAFPAFLGGRVLLSRSRVVEALSMFGPRAPTCNVGDSKGTVITFPSAGKEDTNLVRVNGTRPLGYFPFQVLPLDQACTQWENMISKGAVMIPKGRKGKKEFTDLHRVSFTVSTSPVFEDMYSKIKGMVNEARENAKQSGKRKRDTEDGSSKDGKRQKGDTGLGDDL